MSTTGTKLSACLRPLRYPWGPAEHHLRTTLVYQSGHFADGKESQGHRALAWKSQD